MTQEEMISILTDYSYKKQRIIELQDELENIKALDYSLEHTGDKPYINKASQYNSKIEKIEELENDLLNFYLFLQECLKGEHLLFVCEKYFNNLTVKEISNKYNYHRVVVSKMLGESYRLLADRWVERNHLEIK